MAVDLVVLFYPSMHAAEGAHRECQVAVVHSLSCCQDKGLAMGTPALDMALCSVPVTGEIHMRGVKSRSVGKTGSLTQGSGPWRIGSVIPCAAAVA